MKKLLVWAALIFVVYLFFTNSLLVKVVLHLLIGTTCFIIAFSQRDQKIAPSMIDLFMLMFFWPIILIIIGASEYYESKKSKR